MSQLFLSNSTVCQFVCRNGIIGNSVDVIELALNDRVSVPALLCELIQCREEDTGYVTRLIFGYATPTTRLPSGSQDTIYQSIISEPFRPLSSISVSIRRISIGTLLPSHYQGPVRQPGIKLCTCKSCHYPNPLEKPLENPLLRAGGGCGGGKVQQTIYGLFITVMNRAVDADISYALDM